MAVQNLGGELMLSDGLSVHRMGYGAMQLAGPGVFGEPENRDEAIGVLRKVIELGIDHIDTSDFYGPHVTNRLIKEALYPYPNNLCIVTKVGAIRGDDGSWIHVLTKESLIQQVHDNLKSLGVDVLDVVNLRVGGGAGGHAANTDSIAEPFRVLADLQKEGLIKHLGVSTVTAEQIAEVQTIAPIVCVQNHYNLAHRDDDALIDMLAAQGIAYVPYFPIGGFTPLQSDVLSRVATSLNVSTQQVALAWLLQRSPNIALIPGTASRNHLMDNIAATDLILPQDDLNQLNMITEK